MTKDSTDRTKDFEVERPVLDYLGGPSVITGSLEERSRRVRIGGGGGEELDGERTLKDPSRGGSGHRPRNP